MSSDRGGSDLGTVIIAGAIGATVGAVVALMLAPKAGAELRADLGEKAKEYAEKAKETAAEVAEKAREAAHEVAEKAREKVAEVKDKACAECGEEAAAEEPEAV